MGNGPSQQWRNLTSWHVWLTATRYPTLEPFEHYDRGKHADKSFKNLLGAGSKTEDITSSIGTEVRGVQLTQLNNDGKDELARYVAEKKVVAFRDQDFAKLPIDKALEWGKYFGRLHIHPTSGAPEGYPEVHLVHRGADDQSFKTFFNNRTNSVAWHSDVTYENQPPGTTILYALDVPSAGGDTLFCNMALAYERLSPAFRERLAGLKAVHSGFEQATAAEQKGSFVRRAPVSSVGSGDDSTSNLLIFLRSILSYGRILSQERKRYMSTLNSLDTSSASNKKKATTC